MQISTSADFGFTPPGYPICDFGLDAGSNSCNASNAGAAAEPSVLDRDDRREVIEVLLAISGRCFTLFNMTAFFRVFPARHCHAERSSAPSSKSPCAHGSAVEMFRCAQHDSVVHCCSLRSIVMLNEASLPHRRTLHFCVLQ